MPKQTITGRILGVMSVSIFAAFVCICDLAPINHKRFSRSLSAKINA